MQLFLYHTLTHFYDYIIIITLHFVKLKVNKEK